MGLADLKQSVEHDDTVWARCDVEAKEKFGCRSVVAEMRVLGAGDDNEKIAIGVLSMYSNCLPRLTSNTSQ